MLFMSTVLKKKGKKDVQSSDLVTEYGVSAGKSSTAAQNHRGSVKTKNHKREITLGTKVAE